MLDWSQIEKYYDQGDTAGFIMSFLESEKLLRTVLENKKFPGKNVEQKLTLAKRHLSAPKLLEQARYLVKQLLDLQLPPQVGKQTAEQLLKTYFTATTELSQVSSVEINKDRIKFLWQRWQRLLGKITIYISFIVLSIISLTIFLADTNLGKNVAHQIVAISRFVVYRAVPALLILIILTFIGIGLSIHRRKKKLRAQHLHGQS